MDKPKPGGRKRIPYFYGIKSMVFYDSFSSRFRWELLVILVAFLSGSVKAQIQFDPPIQGPWVLSGTFGELRNNHFHAGLDFKTGGQEGMSILAAADGCLSRIRQGPAGYGLALYLDHDTLFTSVYAHLHHAEPSVAAYLDSIQWANRRFEIDTAIESGRFCFIKGEVIGISGNSGSSEGPHLHFEIRDRKSQEPLNPLPFLGQIRDTIAPVIQQVAVFRSSGSRFELEKLVEIYSNGSDTVVLNTSSASSALAVGVTDPERLGIYRIEWIINDTATGGFRFDRFNYNETRYVNAHGTQVQQSLSPGFKLHRLHRLPGDSCSMFRDLSPCILNFRKDSTTQYVRVVSFDAHGNRVSLLLAVVYASKKIDEHSIAKSEESRLAVFGKAHRFTFHGGAGLELTPRALYQDELFSESVHPVKKGEFRFHPIMIGVQTSFHEPQLMTLPVPFHLRKPETKLVAFRSDSAGGKAKDVLLPAVVEGHHAVFKIRSGGWYALGDDRTPPRVDSHDRQKDDVDGQIYNQCRIFDEFSGIARYEVFRNHRWILAEYDAKSGRLRWKPDPNSGGPHLISIVLEDKCGNRCRFDCVEDQP